MRPANEVYLAMPMYDGTAELGAFHAAHTASEHLTVKNRFVSSSLIPHCFTRPWMDAILSGYQYFAMLHSDVVPQKNWLDVLWEELHRVEADVISAVLPIKTPPDERGQHTSTAIHREGEWERYRLTLEEVATCPTTFDTFDGCPVLVNTGCWLAKVGPWCKKIGGFSIKSEVDWEKGRFRIWPEDWLFSMHARSMGAKVFATKAIRAVHIGKLGWPNDLTDDDEPANGEMEHTAPAEPPGLTTAR